MKKTLTTIYKLPSTLVRNMRTRTWVALGLILIISPILIFTLLKPGETLAEWFDENWAYRQKITFGNSGSADTNKYVEVTVDTETLINEGKLDATCKDLRITDASGKVLDHKFLTGSSVEASTAIPVAGDFSPGSRSDRAIVRDSNGYVYIVARDATDNDIKIFKGYGGATYYFDGSDASATDPDSAWTDDANALDGSTSTYAYTETSGTNSTNELVGEGTNAPASGDSITEVQARVYHEITNSPSQPSWSAPITLTTPSGGWTWAKIQALENVVYFYTDGFSEANVNVEIFTDSQGESLGTITTDSTTPIMGIQGHVYKTEISVLTSASNEPVGFIEQDTSNNPTSSSYSAPSMAIDSGDIIHIAYWAASGGLRYVTFDTSTDTFSGDTLAVAELDTPTSTYIRTGIAVDSNDIPHAVYVDGNTFQGATTDMVFYASKVGGSWDSSGIEVSEHTKNEDSAYPSIAVSDEDIPEISYINTVDSDLEHSYGDANNAASFTINGSVATGVSTVRPTSISIDNDGDTWIGYVGSDGVDLAHDTDGSTWSFTSDITNGVNTSYLSIAAQGSFIHTYYNPGAGGDAFKIMYDTYNHVEASWNDSPTAAAEATKLYPIAKWGYHVNFGSDGTDYGSGENIPEVDYIFSTDSVSGSIGYGNVTYTVVNSCNNASVSIRVHTPNILAGNNILYMYYGNKDAVLSEIDIEGSLFSPTSGPTVGSEEIGPGPVLYQRFDEGVDNTCTDGTSDACDSTTNVLDGANSGAAWQHESLCAKGLCLSFDGTNDVVTTTNDDPIDFNTGLASGFTMMGWVRVNSDGEGNAGQIIQKGTNTYMRITNEGSDGLADLEASLDLGTGGADATATVTNGITLNKWHHVAMGWTEDGDDEISVYIDGKLAATSTNGDNTGGFDADANNFLVGGTTTANFHGFIDEVKIYNYERTEAEIRGDHIKGSAAVLGAADTDYLSDNLVGYWNFNEVSGNAADSSGNGTTLTNNGTTVYDEAKFGRGGELNGSSMYFSATDNAALSVTGDITISTWIIPDDIAGSEDIVAKWDGANESYLLAKEDANIRFYLNSTSNYEATTGDPLTAGARTHVLATYSQDNREVKIYIDGILQASSTTGTIPGSIDDDASVFHIGAEDSSGTAANYFAGHIDDTRVYNRTFTPSEIDSLYNWGEGPIVHFKMDENTGNSSVSDSSGYGHNGSLTGFSADPWAPGKLGSALDFNGGSETVDFYSSSFNDEFIGTHGTAMAWVQVTQFDTSTRRILEVGSGTTNRIFFFQDDSSGDTSLSMQYTANSTTENDAIFLEPGNSDWYHLAMTWDDDNDIVKFYINGVNWGESTGVGDFAATALQSSRVRLGVSGGAPYANVDDVKMYNYALSSNQIREAMLSGNSLGSGTESMYLKFDEGQGQTAYDTKQSEEIVINGQLGTTASADANDPTWLQQDSCVLNSCLEFDGTNHYVIFTDSGGAEDNFDLKSEQDFAFTGWFYRDTFTTDDAILGKNNVIPATSGFQGYGLYIDDATDQLIFNVVDSDNDIYSITSSSTFTAVGWHHFAVVWDDDNENGMRMYIDGVDDSPTLSGTLANIGNILPSDDFTIGAEEDGGIPFDGRLDEIKLYTGTLTSLEVKTDYNLAPINFSVGQNEADDLVDGAPSSPSGYWPLDENTGTSTTVDKSGNDNHGTLTSMTEASWTPGQHGSALNFDGTSDFVTVTDDAIFDLSAGTDYTWSFWVNPDDFSTEWESAWAQSSTSNNYFIVYAHTQSGNGTWGDVTEGLQVGWFSNGNTDAIVTNSNNNVLIGGQWNHVVITYDASEAQSSRLSIFVNGVDETGTNAFNAGTLGTITATDTIIGDNAEFSGEEFDGQIDDVRYYSGTELTHSQISFLYNRGKPVGHWKFDECQGTVANDASGFEQDATITIGGSGTYTSAGTCDSGTSSEMWNTGGSGKRNASFALNTDDHAIATYSSAFPTGDFSVALWVNRGDTNGYDVINIPNSSAERELSVNISGSGVALYTNNGFNVSANTTLGTSTWYHIAATRNGSDLTTYVNGKVANTGSDGVAFDFTSCDLIIGTKSNSGCSSTFGNHFNGQIDDVRLYRYALTEAQIRKIMNDDAGVRFGPDSGSP